MPLGRVAPVNVPLPRSNPFREDDMGAIPAPPAGPTAAPGTAPLGVMDPTAQIADLNAAAVSGDPGMEAGPLAEDPGMGAVPPLMGDPGDGNIEWNAAAAALKQANPDDAPLVGAMRAFINAQAAKGQLQQDADAQALKDAREAEMYGWRKEDRMTEKEQRDRELLWATEDRDLSKEDRARKLKYEEEDRGMARERFADEDRMNDLDYLGKGVEIEKAMEAAKTGTLDANALSRLEYARKMNLEAVDNSDLTPDQAAAEKARITAMYDQVRDELMAVNSRARGMATGQPGAEGEISGDEEEDMGAIPGMDEPEDTEGGQPGAVSNNNEERSDPVGTYGRSGRPSDPVPSGDPAARKPSDVFPAQGEISGAGTKDDPIIGAPEDPEQAKQWQKLYVKPGQVFMYRGWPYIAK